MQKSQLFWAIFPKGKKGKQKFVPNFLTFPGRKGMMDDLFDLFFTIIMAIFALFLINGMLLGGLNQKEVKMNQDVKSLNEAGNYLIKLRTSPEEINFVNAKENLKNIGQGKKVTDNQRQDFLSAF